MEVCHTFGLAILCYMVLPEMDSIRVFLLSSSFALIPACFLLLSRFQEDNERQTHISKFRLAIDIIAIVAGIVQTVLYCDFFYLYVTKVMAGKKIVLPA